MSSTENMVTVCCDLSEAPDAAWTVTMDGYTVVAPVFRRVFVSGTTLVAEAVPSVSKAHNVRALTAMIDARIWWTNLKTGR